MCLDKVTNKHVKVYGTAYKLVGELHGKMFFPFCGVKNDIVIGKWYIDWQGIRKWLRGQKLYEYESLNKPYDYGFHMFEEPSYLSSYKWLKVRYAFKHTSGVQSRYRCIVAFAFKAIEEVKHEA